MKLGFLLVKEPYTQQTLKKKWLTCQPFLPPLYQLNPLKMLACQFKKWLTCQPLLLCMRKIEAFIRRIWNFKNAFCLSLNKTRNFGYNSKRETCASANSKRKTPNSGSPERGFPLYSVRLRGKRINVYGPNTVFHKEE